MEWVETTAKTIEAARDIALDRLGVHADEAEIEIVEEPKSGLFGLMRGEARVRARVKPTQVRAKPDRRRRSRSDRSGASGGSDGATTADGASDGDESDGEPAAGAAKGSSRRGRGGGNRRQDSSRGGSDQQREGADRRQDKEQTMTMSESDAAPDDGPGDDAAAMAPAGGERASSDDRQEGPGGTAERYDADEADAVAPQEVGEAAVAFMDGLLSAFGASGSAELTIDGTELDIAVSGEGLGLLVGSGGRTLNAVQDLARVAAQRRLGDHETRLRIDVAGYRSKRQAALAKFARDVAEMVRSSGSARSMEPMTSADRKVIHDVLNEEPGVSSRSEGEDPNRRIVVVPASD
jgi:spoIIIJ-associated protein